MALKISKIVGGFGSDKSIFRKFTKIKHHIGTTNLLDKIKQVTDDRNDSSSQWPKKKWLLLISRLKWLCDNNSR